MPRFTKWVLRLKTCLSSFQPNTQAKNRRPHNETQTVSRTRRNSVQGIHHCLARSVDALLLFFPPLIEMVAFGYALDNDVKHMAMLVLDEDRTVESRQLVD